MTDIKGRDLEEGGGKGQRYIKVKKVALREDKMKKVREREDKQSQEKEYGRH